MSYFLTVRNDKGEEQLVKLDPTKLKIIRDANPAVTLGPSTSTISRTVQDAGPAVTLGSSTSKTSPTSLIVQSFDNHEAFRQTSGLQFNTVPLLHSNMDDEDAPNMPLAKKAKIESLSEIENNSKENWTEAEVQLLIEQRLAMNNKFENPNSRKTSYWNIIVKVFEEKGYKVKVHDLVNKWKNLLVTYNRNVSKMNRTGESAITWKYFQQMHEVFAEKNYVQYFGLSQINLQLLEKNSDLLTTILLIILFSLTVHLDDLLHY